MATFLPVLVHLSFMQIRFLQTDTFLSSSLAVHRETINQLNESKSVFAIRSNTVQKYSIFAGIAVYQSVLMFMSYQLDMANSFSRSSLLTTITASILNVTGVLFMEKVDHFCYRNRLNNCIWFSN